jgi:hypothetical protein
MLAGQWCFGEQPSSAKWNILGSNDASFADGTGIAADAIKSSQLFYGLIRSRQGGTTGDANWSTSGTSTQATDAKDVFIQAGSLLVNANPTTLTYPNAYTQVPLVIAAVATASTSNVFVICLTRTATQATFRCVTDAGGAATTETINWMTIGQ